MRTLEEIRIAAGISRSKAAESLGITESAYWRKEHGERKLSANEAAKLASLFGVPVEDVVLSDRRSAKSA